MSDGGADLHGGGLTPAAATRLENDHARLRGADGRLHQLVADLCEAFVLQRQRFALVVEVGLGAVLFALGAGVHAVVLVLELTPVGVDLLRLFRELVPEEQVERRAGLVEIDLGGLGGEFVGLQFTARDVAEFLEFPGPLDLARGAFEFLVGQVDGAFELAFLLEGVAAQVGVRHEFAERHLAFLANDVVGQAGTEVLAEVDQAELDVEPGDRQQALAGALLDGVGLVGLLEGGLGRVVFHLLGLDEFLKVGRIEFDEFVALLDDAPLLDGPDDGAHAFDLAADVHRFLGVNLAALRDRDHEAVANGAGRLTVGGSLGLRTAQHRP